jgi:leader peptidase (prepilin peptidase)/N-methyltransferase
MEPRLITFCILVFVFGLSIGSFLNVCIYRLPLGLSIAKGRSFCPGCQAKIAWYDNIPLLSFVLLGAKCRSCRQVISWIYPLVESFTAVLFLVSFWKFGLSWQFLSSLVLISALIAISFIDLKHQIIPDIISLPGILLGVVISIFIPDFSWLNSVVGVLVGGIMFYFLAVGGQLLFKKESLGGGDIKLAAMLGAFLGWKKLILVFFLSSLLGALAGLILILAVKQFRGSRIIPFGPFLALASLVALFAGDNLINLYLSHFWLR